jgi:hypothetical protein
VYSPSNGGAVENNNDAWARGPFRIPVGYCADGRLIVEVLAPVPQGEEGTGELLAEVWVCPGPTGVIVLLKDEDGKEVRRMQAPYLETPQGGALTVSDREWGA